jgi:hypothetical protein
MEYNIAHMTVIDHHVASLYTKPAFVREISVVLTPR